MEKSSLNRSLKDTKFFEKNFRKIEFRKIIKGHGYDKNMQQCRC